MLEMTGEMNFKQTFRQTKINNRPVNFSEVRCLPIINAIYDSDIPTIIHAADLRNVLSPFVGSRSFRSSGFRRDTARYSHTVPFRSRKTDVLFPISW